MDEVAKANEAIFKAIVMAEFCAELEIANALGKTLAMTSNEDTAVILRKRIAQALNRVSEHLGRVRVCSSCSGTKRAAQTDEYNRGHCYCNIGYSIQKDSTY